MTYSLREEFENEMTIKCNIFYTNLANKTVAFIDGPGNMRHVHHQIKNISVADHATVVVSATEGEFETETGKYGLLRD